MKKLEVFDPPLCCPTGVCGSTPSATLTQFAADLDWLQRQGVQVSRYRLTYRISEFARTQTVNHAIHKHGLACLPLLLVDGQIVSMSRYPTRDELAVWVSPVG